MPWRLGLLGVALAALGGTHAAAHVSTPATVSPGAIVFSSDRTGDAPAVVTAVHLRDAVHALEELVGRVDVEDILDEVFRRFCVGK